jgi:hypothetical protein
MPAPVALGQFRKFFLQSSRGPSLQSPYYIANRLRRWILNVDVDMILTYHPFQYPNIFCITYLFYQLPTSYLNIPFKNVKSIFRNPYYVGCQPRYTMTALPLFITHRVKLQKWVATESLALKAHSFN